MRLSLGGFRLVVRLVVRSCFCSVASWKLPVGPFFPGWASRALGAWNTIGCLTFTISTKSCFI